MCWAGSMPCPVSWGATITLPAFWILPWRPAATEGPGKRALASHFLFGNNGKKLPLVHTKGSFLFKQPTFFPDPVALFPKLYGTGQTEQTNGQIEETQIITGGSYKDRDSQILQADQ